MKILTALGLQEAHTIIYLLAQMVWQQTAEHWVVGGYLLDHQSENENDCLLLGSR